MMVVQIQQPANIALAAWFNEVRSWFDKNGCQPALFSPSGRVMGTLIFDVMFENDTNARLFASNFTEYASSIRRTIGAERLDLLRRESRDRTVADDPPTPSWEGL
jgi:hypothetical protein